MRFFMFSFNKTEKGTLTNHINSECVCFRTITKQKYFIVMYIYSFTYEKYRHHINFELIFLTITVSQLTFVLKTSLIRRRIRNFPT